MSDFNPSNMLREYRRQSDDEMRNQADAFRALSATDQRELVFWMVMHLTAGLQHVHSIVEKGGAATRSFDDLKTKTHS